MFYSFCNNYTDLKHATKNMILVNRKTKKYSIPSRILNGLNTSIGIKQTKDSNKERSIQKQKVNRKKKSGNKSRITFSAISFSTTLLCTILAINTCRAGRVYTNWGEKFFFSSEKLCKNPDWLLFLLEFSFQVSGKHNLASEQSILLFLLTIYILKVYIYVILF